MKGFSNFGKIAIVNMRHFFLLSLLFTLLFEGFLLYQFGVFQLNSRTIHKVFEMFLPLLGIVWMSSICLPEQTRDIEAVVRIRKISYWQVLVLRLMISSSFIVLAILLYSGILQWNSTAISGKVLFATIVNALFLGSIGCLVHAVTRQSTTSLMIPILFYLLNFFLPKELGVLYLFDLDAERWWMVGVTIVLYTLALLRKS